MLTICLLAALSEASGASDSVVVGNVRVTALSDTLVRIEPRGPKGFEDRTTFSVVGRDEFPLLSIRTLNTSASGTWLGTSAYAVFIPASGVGSTGLANATVATLDGRIIWEGKNTGTASKVAPNALHWPSPLSASAYAFEDRPRFHVPEWGPTPIPKGSSVDPALLPTNGYDFQNDVVGDTYVFLLGSGLDGWWRSRGEFLTLAGPTPLLPDFAYGIWYTWYIRYTEQRAKDEIGNWTKARLPLDVWALDMNWRHIAVNESDPASVKACRTQTVAVGNPKCRDHFYNSPNLDLMPGLASPENEWFSFIKAQKLKTYFNDHPFPVADQASPKEVAFRYNGISEWIGRGLSYWWFDHNWGFTLPGPRLPFNSTDPYEGLSGQCWGSHVYFEATKAAYAEHGIRDRPIALTRDNGPNWRTPKPEQQSQQGAGSPAHHRYPVWWTGDWVPLMASVESMVDEAVHDFRAFVHSDCGGHGDRSSCPATVTGAPPEDKPCSTPNDAALLRWTAHCVLGTVVRFHQGDHRFWLRDSATQDSARAYLNMRHTLAPSLIAAGHTLQSRGFPLTARCDLLWPEHAEARDPTQYIHLNATLVAPLDVEPTDNVSNSRTVWIPPGEWTDGWSGATVTGPATMNVTQPAHRIPMWHKRGAILVTNPSSGLRIIEQEWDELTIEAFPAAAVDSVEVRELHEQESSQHADADATEASLRTYAGNATVVVSLSASPIKRSWTCRLHLRHASQRLSLPGSPAALAAAGIVPGSLRHLLPAHDCAASHFPFGGEGSPPACEAGPIAEFKLSASRVARRVEAEIV